MIKFVIYAYIVMIFPVIVIELIIRINKVIEQERRKGIVAIKDENGITRFCVNKGVYNDMIKKSN
jgi:hypothetical protein